MKKAVFNWSGGKDSALALYKILQEKEYEVISLLTVINDVNLRSPMHAIPLPLLKKQSESIGIPLFTININPLADNKEYKDNMKKAVEYFKAENVEYFIFGDIFLDDIKEYRERQLTPYGIKVVEPLWGKAPEEVMGEFISSGLQTIVVSAMADKLDNTFIGRTIDNTFLQDLPEDVDICGENGEYHTFCYNGSIFSFPIDFVLDKPVKIDYSLPSSPTPDKSYYWFSYLHDAESIF